MKREREKEKEKERTSDDKHDEGGRDFVVASPYKRIRTMEIDGDIPDLILGKVFRDLSLPALVEQGHINTNYSELVALKMDRNPRTHAYLYLAAANIDASASAYFMDGFVTSIEFRTGGHDTTRELKRVSYNIATKHLEPVDTHDIKYIEPVLMAPPTSFIGKIGGEIFAWSVHDNAVHSKPVSFFMSPGARNMVSLNGSEDLSKEVFGFILNNMERMKYLYRSRYGDAWIMTVFSKSSMYGESDYSIYRKVKKFHKRLEDDHGRIMEDTIWLVMGDKVYATQYRKAYSACIVSPDLYVVCYRSKDHMRNYVALHMLKDNRLVWMVDAGKIVMEAAVLVSGDTVLISAAHPNKMRRYILSIHGGMNIEVGFHIREVIGRENHVMYMSYLHGVLSILVGSRSDGTKMTKHFTRKPDTLYFIEYIVSYDIVTGKKVDWTVDTDATPYSIIEGPSMDFIIGRRYYKLLIKESDHPLEDEERLDENWKSHHDYIEQGLDI